MTSIRKLRIINAIGCVLFIAYALLIDSWPTVMMNVGALIIDVVHLYKLSRIRVSFELVPATRDGIYFSWFMNKHMEDIKLFDSKLRFTGAEQVLYYVRDDEVAGILAYNTLDELRAEIVLDYVTPKFRDFRIGRYFFGANNVFFKEAGITQFITRTANPTHEAYLRKIAFKKQASGVWAKDFDSADYKVPKEA